MFKIEYINTSGQKANETIKDQHALVKFVATLDSLDCYIINIYMIGGKGKARAL